MRLQNVTDAGRLQQEIEELRQELRDLRVLHENTVEHNTLTENELEERNQRINNLMTSMKMYLSPQLYNSIVAGTYEAKLRHQRKKLTMFFSDIAGFTQITDIIEPEALSGLLNDYLTRMSSIAVKYGGTIDKYIGDAIVVFFGDPEYVDDVTHARQCVLMAIEMLDEIKRLSRQWSSAGCPGGLGVRIGINTGYCTVGNFGSETRMDYTIIGGQVNIAARIENIADRNSIFISESTYGLVKDMVDVEKPQILRVRGIHFPVAVYKVIGQHSDEPERRPLLERTEQGFFLHPIAFSGDPDADERHDEIVRALENALEIVRDAQEPRRASS